MRKLIPMYYDDQTSILVEVAEDVEIEDETSISPSGDTSISPIRDTSAGRDIADKAIRTLRAASDAISGYCSVVRRTFEDMDESERPDKATVEFGIQLSAEGSAYVVKGSAQANLKVTAEWTFSSS